MVQFVQTHRGGKALLYEGYKYLRSVTESSTHFGDARGTWANAQQDWLPMKVVQSSRGEHNHPPDLAANQVKAIQLAIWGRQPGKKQLLYLTFMMKHYRYTKWPIIVHVIMQVDFVGSWFNGSWAGGKLIYWELSYLVGGDPWEVWGYEWLACSMGRWLELGNWLFLYFFQNVNCKFRCSHLH